MSYTPMPPPLGSEEEIQNTVQEWEAKYSNVDRTTRMLQTLRETHETGVDSLVKLGVQGEQMNRIEKLALENEHDIENVKYRHSANEKIYKNREERRLREEEEKRIKDIKEMNENQNNPFTEGAANNNNSPDNMGARPRTRKAEPEESGGLSSRLWGPSTDHSGKAEASMVNMRPMNTPNENDLQDNVYIQKAHWLKTEDEQLDEMGLILGELKNIAIAQHTEVQQQSLKMDDIGASFERGSDFNLKRKSSKQVAKEKKKAEKEEQKKAKEEIKKQKNLNIKVEKEIGHKAITKEQLTKGPKPNEVGNPFLQSSST
ncbi:culmination specific protein 37D [Heterostelium album PN500]|uniref:Culmination specific protein 37D n=1 Tax=Heterostelium pallidum (strain ATCC 26659 / Pp 5 / PN500) TaxID=670386 RepID=D3AZZ1_HETP5|nr:culmination specific protein 37D [Heterostelium album PN500]EFA84615.1 culmination specific protein 37D [Heterostelium album PN500]|eukprot:XP_020436728.1 culmination specific protein 37D [Heterostelium album PN500]